MFSIDNDYHTPFSFRHLRHSFFTMEWLLFTKFDKRRFIQPYSFHYTPKSDCFEEEQQGYRATNNLFVDTANLLFKTTFSCGYALTLSKINSRLTSTSIVKCISRIRLINDALHMWLSFLFYIKYVPIDIGQLCFIILMNCSN